MNLIGNEYDVSNLARIKIVNIDDKYVYYMFLDEGEHSNKNHRAIIKYGAFNKKYILVLGRKVIL